MEKRSHLLKFHVAEETIQVKVFGTSLEGQGACTVGEKRQQNFPRSKLGSSTKKLMGGLCVQKIRRVGGESQNRGLG
jgi:hypothetical protein